MLTEIFGSGLGPRHSWEVLSLFQRVCGLNQRDLKATSDSTSGGWSLEASSSHTWGLSWPSAETWAGLGVVAPPCGQALFHSRTASELRDQSGTRYITIYDLFLKATRHGSAIVCWLQQIISLSRSKEREIKSHLLMEEKQSVGDGRYCCNYL